MVSPRDRTRWWLQIKIIQKGQPQTTQRYFSNLILYRRRLEDIGHLAAAKHENPYSDNGCFPDFFGWHTLGQWSGQYDSLPRLMAPVLRVRGERSAKVMCRRYAGRGIGQQASGFGLRHFGGVGGWGTGGRLSGCPFVWMPLCGWVPKQECCVGNVFAFRRIQI